MRRLSLLALALVLLTPGATLDAQPEQPATLDDRRDGPVAVSPRPRPDGPLIPRRPQLDPPAVVRPQPDRPVALQLQRRQTEVRLRHLGEDSRLILQHARRTPQLAPLRTSLRETAALSETLQRRWVQAGRPALPEGYRETLALQEEQLRVLRDLPAPELVNPEVARQIETLRRDLELKTMVLRDDSFRSDAAVFIRTRNAVGEAQAGLLVQWRSHFGGRWRALAERSSPVRGRLPVGVVRLRALRSGTAVGEISQLDVIVPEDTDRLRVDIEVSADPDPMASTPEVTDEARQRVRQETDRDVREQLGLAPEGDAPSAPLPAEVQDELRQHASRMARIERIERLARELDRDDLAQRITALRIREEARHRGWMAGFGRR